MVRGGAADDILDLRFLFHSSVPHGRASELREEIQDTDRSARLRFRTSEEERIRHAAGRWRLHLRLVPGRSPFQFGHDATRRIVPENFVRRCPFREYSSQSSSISCPDNKDSEKQFSNTIYNRTRVNWS